jgi:hypothetical protein
MNFLTEDQKQRIKKCYSGVSADVFVELKVRQQETYMSRLDLVLDKIVKESPDLFRGSFVKQVMLRSK